MQQRVCVQQCPIHNDKLLKCNKYKHNGCQLVTKNYTILQTEPYYLKYGIICLPTQNQQLKAQIQQQTKQIDNFYVFVNICIICIIANVILSVLYAISLHFCTQFMYFLIPKCVCGIIILQIPFVLYQSLNYTLTISIILVLITSLLIIIVNLYKLRFALKIQYIFVCFSKDLLKQHLSILLIIPLYYVFISAFFSILAISYTSFKYAYPLDFNPDQDLFYHANLNNYFLFYVLFAILAIGGFSFFRYSCKYCICCYTAFWFYGQNITVIYVLKTLLCKHLGSIIAAAFMCNPISYILSTIFDTFRQNHKTKQTFYLQNFTNYSGICSFLSLFRQSSIPYIAITANPFCNSCRYNEYFRLRTILNLSGQSINVIVKLCAYIMIISVISFTLCLWNKQVFEIYWCQIVFICIVVCSPLIIIHFDIAQTVISLFMIQQTFIQQRIQTQSQIEKLQTIDNQFLQNYFSQFTSQPELKNKILQQLLFQSE